MRAAYALPVSILALALGACLGGTWARVQAEDSPAGYRRFLRQHPGAPQAAQARERLAVLALERDPTHEGLMRLRREFPASDALPALEPRVEAAEFERARREGTVDAYERFLELLPDGAHAKRARGNAAYLNARGFVTRPDELLAFTERFPASDFTAEARRSLGLPALRQRTRVDRVGLRVVVADSTPNAPRLAAAFREHAERTYASAGLPLVVLPSGSKAVDPGVDAILEIHHQEDAAGTEVVAGRMMPAGVRSRTQVSVTRAGEDTPIWRETFRFRAPDGEGRRGDSILFGVRAPVFWRGFFVPVARWRSDATRRGLNELPEGAIAVDARGQRAFALFTDGRFRVLDLADPERPRLVSEYRRPRDLARFDGVWGHGDRVAVFGEGGLEMVALGGEPRRIAALSRDQVGTVRAVTELGDDVFVAGTRGLLRIAERGTGKVETLLARPVTSVARLGARHLAFLDDGALYVATLEELEAGRVGARVRLGFGFRARRLRVEEGLAAVVGELGVACFDLSRPHAPRSLVRLARRDVGRVHDAAVIETMVFLLGERGLQVLDPRAGRIVESVDVDPRSRVASWGRHLVALDQAALQTVDASPWLWRTAPAAPAPGSSGG